MLAEIHPKLPMRNKEKTRAYYIDQLGFVLLGGDYPDYLMIKKDHIEIHFFQFSDLAPKDNYGQVYIRVEGIEEYYRELLGKGVKIHPNAPLSTKPWGQKEFALLDPDMNLLTFGEKA